MEVGGRGGNVGQAQPLGQRREDTDRSLQRPGELPHAYATAPKGRTDLVSGNHEKGGD